MLSCPIQKSYRTPQARADIGMPCLASCGSGRPRPHDEQADQAMIWQLKGDFVEGKQPSLRPRPNHNDHQYSRDRLWTSLGNDPGHAEW